MTNNLISRSKGKSPQSDHLLQNCAEQVQSAKNESRNRLKWQLICVVIIIISMQGFCNLGLLKTTNQAISAVKTSVVPQGIHGFTASWWVREGAIGDRSSTIANGKQAALYNAAEDNVFNLTGSGNRAAPPTSLGYLNYNPGVNNCLGCRFPAICVKDKTLILI